MNTMIIIYLIIVIADIQVDTDKVRSLLQGHLPFTNFVEVAAVAY